MAYDEDLAARVRALLADESGITEMRAFGGLAFLVDGNMAVSASSRGGLMVRVDPTETEALLNDRHAHRFVMRGREMNGWLGVDADGLTTEEALTRWVDRGLAFARSLPPKR